MEHSKKAQELSLRGWVFNLPNRRGEAVFQGEEALLAEIIQWYHEGSPLAKVEHVFVSEEAHPKIFSDFSIEP